MKSILLHVNDDLAQDDRLAVALDLARAHDAHISCVQAGVFDIYLASDPMGGFAGYAELFGVVRARAVEARARIEARLSHEDVSWDFELCEGDPVRTLVSRARLADLIVLSRAADDDGTQPGPMSIAGEVAVNVRAPVLVVPPSVRSFDSKGVVAVAWNGSPEAAHSLRMTLPQLRLASAVHLVTVDADVGDFPATDGCRYLSRHGIKSELHEYQSDGRSVAETLLAAVALLHANCLVMGAYGRSRLRETVFGGVTHDLLNQSQVSLLLAH